MRHLRSGDVIAVEESDGLVELRLGVGGDVLGWTVDAAVLLLRADGRVADPTHFVFYNNPAYGNERAPWAVVVDGNPNPAIGDSAELRLALEVLPESVERAVIAMSVDPQDAGSGSLADASGLYLRDSSADLEWRFDIDPAELDCGAAVLAEVVRTHTGTWTLRAGTTMRAPDLATLVRQYGVQVAAPV